MVKGGISAKTVTLTLGIGKTTNTTVLEYILVLMVHTILVNGLRERKVDMVMRNGLMVPDTKVAILKARSMVKDSSLAQTNACTMETLSKMSLMDTVRRIANLLLIFS